MATPTDSNTPLPVHVERWLAAFHRDRPMHESFPVILPNRATIHTFTGICSACKQPVDPMMVRGRVMWSLPDVATIDANSYCTPCQRITHHDCRFRSTEKTYRAEWPGLDGRWYSKIPPQPRWWRTLVQTIRSLWSL